MEHEIHDVLFRWGQAPDDALPSLVQQLHFVPRSAVLTTHQAAAHTDFISQCLREEQDTGAQSLKQTGGKRSLVGDDLWRELNTGMQRKAWAGSWKMESSVVGAEHWLSLMACRPWTQSVSVSWERTLFRQLRQWSTKMDRVDGGAQSQDSSSCTHQSVHSPGCPFPVIGSEVNPVSSQSAVHCGRRHGAGDP